MDSIPSLEERLREQRDEEAFAHAECLAIATTGKRWRDDVTPTAAMEKVYSLYLAKERWKEVATKAAKDRDYFANIAKALTTDPPELAPWRATAWRISRDLSLWDWSGIIVVAGILVSCSCLALVLSYWFGWGAVAGAAFGMFVVFVLAYLK